VKKTKLTEYDSPRTGGLIAVNLREGDELVGARLASSADDLILVSRKGQSVRFHATDDALRPMGRATSGVVGMRFRDGDELLSMSVVEHGEDPDVFVVFENGLAKRSPASDYPIKGRATLGVRVAQVSERGGDLVGALTVDEDDEVMVVMEKGKIVRSRVDEVRRTGRNTQGVRFAAPDGMTRALRDGFFLVRCPDGIAHPCFFQKHVSAGTPAELGLPKVSAPEPALTSRESACPW
jgi:DNA gyrase subunit A